MLDLVEEALNEISRFVKVLGKADWVFTVGFGRNVRPSSARGRHVAQGIGVIALVGKEHGALRQIGDHLWRAFDVASLPCSQFELQRSTLLVDQRVDFCREPASGAAQTSISPPLFAVAPC